MKVVCIDTNIKNKKIVCIDPGNLIFYIVLIMIIKMQMNLDTLKTVEEKNVKLKNMLKLFWNLRKKK
jgi:hypothetical protein